MFVIPMFNRKGFVTLTDSESEKVTTDVKQSYGEFTLPDTHTETETETDTDYDKLAENPCLNTSTQFLQPIFSVSVSGCTNTPLEPELDSV